MFARTYFPAFLLHYQLPESSLNPVVQGLFVSTACIIDMKVDCSFSVRLNPARKEDASQEILVLS
jgi:hypothetical protein